VTAPVRGIAAVQLAAEFPSWRLALMPSSSRMLEASWASVDGRTRWYVFSPTAAGLLERLRAIRDQP
jgi:hypothetical protein